MFKVRQVGKTLVNRTAGTRIASDGLKGRVYEVSLADLQSENDAERSFRKFKLICEDVQVPFKITRQLLLLPIMRIVVSFLLSVEITFIILALKLEYSILSRMIPELFSLGIKNFRIFPHLSPLDMLSKFHQQKLLTDFLSYWLLP